MTTKVNGIESLRVRLHGEWQLRHPAEHVDTVNKWTNYFIERMKVTMRENDGVGLAANQVDMLRTPRIAIADQLVMINPTIIHLGHRKTFMEEGCLSLPGVMGGVWRWESINLEALNQSGKKYNVTLHGIMARIVQHEVDHLNGVMFFDHMPFLKRWYLLHQFRKRRDENTQRQ